MPKSLEPLSAQEKKALKVISGTQRMIATITARELSDALGYSSSRSGHSLIVRLEEAGRIKRTNRGQIEVLFQ